ncbi:hypothetical protein OIE67_16570 [Nonomuraea fuscirosea]|uniref:hypothetical protein n=1 Tax=Nonomuraea fuscirosea TaxID=1291556 RepID=UPI002DDC3282|nr:hypothetical protein [Nonomuraea fuscirosea]WSA56154.1 hypothetical protein OIE67_16570 [Nonomuraea fuscirosea]
MDILGIPIPDAGPVFLAALAVHIPAGLTCVISGAVAALTRKGGAAHRHFGRVYVWGLAVVFGTMTVMSAIRWRENAHLFFIGVVALAAGCAGYRDRRGRLSDRVHITCMGVSYVALLTAFYVDNGPHLPVWDRLPTWAFWLLPSLLGLPVIFRAIRARGPAS